MHLHPFSTQKNADKKKKKKDFKSSHDTSLKKKVWRMKVSKLAQGLAADNNNL